MIAVYQSNIMLNFNDISVHTPRFCPQNGRANLYRRGPSFDNLSSANCVNRIVIL